MEVDVSNSALWRWSYLTVNPSCYRVSYEYGPVVNSAMYTYFGLDRGVR
jgi:hypothetical protein